MPNIDDVIGDRDRQRMAGGPTPSFQFQNFPTPAPQQLMDQYRQEMFSSLNVGSMQAMGLARAQSMNINNPYSGNMGAAAGMAPPWMMTPASQGVFRPGPSTPPLALTSTPGVTNAFTNPSDLSTQYELMRTGMFADPGSASQNYGRMKLHQFGQQYGGGIGTAIGMAATPFTGGIGGALIGGLGQMATENLNNIPGVGGALRWGIGAMNQNVAEQLAWTGGAQHGTLGNVALGPGEMGLGGRGMNTQSAMKLGRRMRQMSQETGRPDEAGSMNQADMLNLLRTAGDVGFLESATNVDQIAKTVGGLMKLVGSLAKITGDPDFRNNLRELGQMRTMGLSTDQGVNALQSMNTWSRMAGMTRGQAMEQGGAPGAQRAVAAGLTPAVGQLAGVHALGQARMLRGTFSETQQALFGDMSQTLTEGQVGFASGVMPYLVPSLLSAGAGGKVSLDKEKIRKMLQGGALDMGQIAGQGAQNLSEVAQKAAEGRAKSEGRELRGADVPDEMLRIMAQMREFKSDLAQTLTPAKTEFLRYQLFQGLQKHQGIGQFAAATAMAGGNTDEAQLLLQKWTNPDYAKRAQAFEQESLDIKKGQQYRESLGLSDQLGEEREIRSNRLKGYWREAKRWWQAPMKMSQIDLIRADKEARQIQRDADEVKGLSRVPLAGVAASASSDFMKSMREGVETNQNELISRTANRRTGDQFLSEEEGRIAGRMFGDEDKWQSLVRSGTVSEWEQKGGNAIAFSGEQNWPQQLQTNVGRFLLGNRGAKESVVSRGGLSADAVRSKIHQVRNAIMSARPTLKAIETAVEMSDDAYLQASRNMVSAIAGSPGSGPPVAILSSIKSKLVQVASTRGENGNTINVDDLRQIVKKELTSAGLGEGAAQRILDQSNFIDPWIAKTIQDSVNPNAQKALQAGGDVETLIQTFDIKTGEQAIKDTEKQTSLALYDAGVLKEDKTWFEQGEEWVGRILSGDKAYDKGASAKRKLTAKYAVLPQEGREAFEKFFKSSRDIGTATMGADKGPEGAMLSLLVSRSLSGTDKEKEHANRVMDELMLDPKTGAATKKATKQIKEGFLGATDKQKETMVGLSRMFLPEGFSGTAQETMNQMLDVERKAYKREGPAAEAYRAYAVRAVGERTGAIPIQPSTVEPKPTKSITGEPEVVDRFDKAVTQFGNLVAQAQLLQGNP